ncbi:MAG: TM0106 family RecB-like putative nuclease [Nitrospirae bacterium]|nr:TM0106 family RecB-like putative nuclease [Nitrospirota bacterium]
MSSYLCDNTLVYNPIIFLPHQKISKQYKLLLAFCSAALSYEQKADPISGRIIFGDRFTSTKVQLASLIKAVGKIEKEIAKMVDTQTAPPLRLNNHCEMCEFRESCYAAAKEKDDLSLLKGLSGKEIDTLNRRGIFTVTQYSYTFRQRRAKKLAASRIIKHHHSLNALAIRTQTIYIAGKPELPSATTRVYLDVEGIPDENFYYLIGLIIDDGTNVTPYSFWANHKAEEKIIWESFLGIIERIGDFVLLHYGNYESKYIKQMSMQYGGDSELLKKIKSRTFNILSAIYGRIYFPTYSNDLKSIALFLGFHWSDPNASGLQSILWRQKWELRKDKIWNQKIVAYNHEDCNALRILEKMLQGIANNNNIAQWPTKNTSELHPEKPLGIFKKNNFFFPELERINSCAYFDYQRTKVYYRTNPNIKKILKRNIRIGIQKLKINKVVTINEKIPCPRCQNKKTRIQGRSSRIIYDLKIFNGGIKRWITKYKLLYYYCEKCRLTYSLHSQLVPPNLTQNKWNRYGKTLMAWAVNQNIARRKSYGTISEDLKDNFGYYFRRTITHEFKKMVSHYYGATYNNLINTLRRGPLIHVDETDANIQGAKGYVWVFSNMEVVVYLYRETREGSVLKEMLDGFNGVLISDFYTAYDSISCLQQKCLIHLIRDVNEDILKNPFDKELIGLGRNFTQLLSPIIETVDAFGLKRRHLNKHKSKVHGFFNKIEQKEFKSEVANNFQRRLLKYRDKLFTFLDYDGVPCNNNNAEYAIKHFVHLRDVIGGTSTKKGIQEYLVLLSICETLRLRNASFLKFLISGETDIDKFLEA